MKMRIGSLVFLFLFAGPSIYAQVFTSYAGGFTVEMPKSSGSGGNGIAVGVEHAWDQPEATYRIGSADRSGLPLALIDGKFSYEKAVGHYYNKFSLRGERIYVKDAFLAGNPGFEYKFKTQTALFILRLFLIGERVYQLAAEIPLKNSGSENKVITVLDSVRLLDKETVDKAIAKRIADATPPPLPQTPAITRPESDAQQQNLKGKIHTLFTETARYAPNDSLRGKQPSIFEEFALNGNLLKKVEFDSIGIPREVSGYGYLDGKRVARIRHAEGYINRPGIPVNFPSSVKLDDRFEHSYTYKYLGGKLIEERHYLSGAVLFTRITYRYLKNRKEIFYYDGGTKPYNLIFIGLDENGDEILMVEKRPGDGIKHYELKYELYDKQGNWTRRTVYERISGLGPRARSFPEYVEYRTITYHP